MCLYLATFESMTYSQSVLLLSSSSSWSLFPDALLWGISGEHPPGGLWLERPGGTPQMWAPLERTAFRRQLFSCCACLCQTISGKQDRVTPVCPQCSGTEKV